MQSIILFLATSTLISQVWGLSQVFQIGPKNYILFDANFDAKDGEVVSIHLVRQEGAFSKNETDTFIPFKNEGPETLHIRNEEDEFKLLPGKTRHMKFNAQNKYFIATKVDNTEFTHHIFHTIKGTWNLSKRER
ncbi:hypothetical protein PGT21_026183 [Puccinia graminis f. sp. tritici]|uniref:Uncharacterized protein n=1 Tax=Puccinia graminis f. sp. tritici TaxID=56615 RepID=A0A5B0N7F3_PUCGR|nr:hypothetical protein PGT21_025910 [Puccinia graminis f. sp. tritici]KAA1084384.1 hypothetical protein PGT21_026183 [Puccinia graminis f. sp. tritici]KAA1092238.1 hypothetical protein PGTUg99_003406 [Puccinia graminis f. sp. tritici]KAA1109606.1 hypothetical protein PGTUg99_026023 [Puccinia graminis f. sp. tritici]